MSGSGFGVTSRLLTRNALSKVSGERRQQQLLEALRDVWAAPTRELAEERLARLITSLRKPLPELSEWLETTAHETLAVHALPAGDLRRKLRSTNSIEHEHGEMQRRTKVVRIFPNDASLLRLGPPLRSSGTSSGWNVDISTQRTSR